MATGGADKKEDSPIADQPSQPEKHPLQNKWSLWFFKPEKKDWKENFKIVTSFDTVEDFWAVYNHIKPPSSIQSGCDYMLFKEGIEPMWEDRRNKDGGRWLFGFDKKRDKDVLDTCWMETLMCLVGEGFHSSSDEICGAVVNIRSKGDKISIWTGRAKNEKDVMVIGEIFKDKLALALALPRGSILNYQSHQDTMSKSGSSSRSLYRI